LVFLACDLAVTATVWVLAYYARFAYFDAPHGAAALERVFELLQLVLVSAVAAYHLCGLYEIHRLWQLPRELGVVFRACAMLFLLTNVAIFWRRDMYESRLALVLFLVINAFALTFVRRVVWRVLKMLRSRGLNRGRAVIVGSGR